MRNQLGGARPGDGAEAGYLGLIGDDTADSSGVRLLEVYANQPAAQGGLAAGDLITEIDGRKIRTVDEMLAALQGKAVGAQLPIAIQRDGAEQKLNVTLGRRPPAEQPSEDLPAPEQPVQPPVPKGPRLGVRTVPVTPEVQRQNALPDTAGAQVVSVAVGSPAEQVGIPLGAVITAVNGTPIRTPEDLATAIRRIKAPEVKLKYVESGRPLEATATLDIPAATLAPPATTGAPLLETRARPPQASPLAPAEVQPALPAAGDDVRIEAIEKRVQELETRLKALEEKQADE